MKRVSQTIAFAVILSLSGFLLAQEHGGKEHAGTAATASSAAAGTPAATAPAPAGGAQTVLLEDDLPASASTEGSWLWDTASPASGTKAHGHPSAKEIQSHGVAFEPVMIPLGSMVTQQVWLDPADPPKGIMLEFKLATGEEVGVYWEGEEEVFNPGEEEEVWYYGLLPELGKWSTLEVLAEDLGIEEEQVTGLSFVTFDGRALWDKTVLTQAPAEEAVAFFPELPAPGEPGKPES